MSCIVLAAEATEALYSHTNNSRERAILIGSEEETPMCVICFSESVNPNCAPVSCEKCFQQARFVCLDCATKHYKGIITTSFDGACPRMRCPVCLDFVHSNIWKTFVDKETAQLFERRASNLLSIRCNGCESRISQLPLAKYQGRITDEDDEMSVSEEAILRMPCGNVLRKVLFAYEHGQIQHTDMFDYILEVFGGLELVRSQADAEGTPRFTTNFSSLSMNNLHHAILYILRCVHDSERRATLHCRYLYYFPKIRSVCCNVTLCFKCRTASWHANKTCEEIQSSMFMNNDMIVVPCPGCGISLVKGDGCSSVRCVCNHVMSWDVEMNKMRMMREKAIIVQEIPWVDPQALSRVRSMEECHALRAAAYTEFTTSVDIMELKEQENLYHQGYGHYYFPQKQPKNVREALLNEIRSRRPQDQ